MKIDTKYFGSIDIDSQKVLRFPETIPGFDTKNYALIPFFPDDDSLLCLQSIEDPELAFALINPFYVDTDYEPRLTDDDLNTLASDKDTPLAFYAIAVIRENFKDTTVNLKCPIAVNPDKRLGKQVVMEDDRYSMHAPISPAGKEG